MSLTPCQPNDLHDNKLFEFDPYEPSIGGGFLEGSSRSPAAPCSHGARSNMINLASSTYPTDSDLDQPIRSSTAIEEESTDGVIGKGKGVSRPVPIRAHIEDNAHDVFDMSPPGLHSFSPPADPTGLGPPLSPPTDAPFNSSYTSVPDDTDVPPLGPDFSGDPLFDDEPFATHTFGKGKGRDIPPSLPPLQFSPTEFEQTVWPRSGSTSAGPSSFGSGFASIAEPTPITEITVQANPSTQTPPTVRRIPSRRRSLSNLSIRSDISQVARSITRVRAKFRGSRTLARKLLFRKREAFSNPSSRPTSAYEPGHLSLENADLSDITQGSCFMPWLGEIRSRRDSAAGLTCHDHELRPGLQRFPVFESFDQKHPASKHKGRSNSSPFPISALDIIPAASSDVFVPIPIVVRNYFDDILPKELRLQILASLVLLHQEEYERVLRDGQWTISKATSSRNKCVGRDKGTRELVRMSRVSRSWKVLVFDGQLWTQLNLRAFPKMPASFFLRLSEGAGPFIKSLDLTGHTHLLSATLNRVTDELCMKSAMLGSVGHAQLTTVNLKGCTALTTRALHHLLVRCPALQTLCLAGLPTVKNATCDLLSTHCHRLTSLDVSRCVNVDGEGIWSWMDSAVTKGIVLPLRQLRMSGLKYVTDGVMAMLGKAAPHLEVLDLSYVRGLHNSSLDAFVACDEDVQGVETVSLTSREAGRDPTDSTRYRRRITRLRHLSLSSCILLTDIACSNLAHAVPRLEFLELAGIGALMRDAGVVHLLGTTPLIRRLDLEDASEITDAVLASLTPGTVPIDGGAPPPPEPGQVLEHLVISYASSVTDDALLALIRACTRLKVLEADNTRMSGTVLKEFVKLARRRRIVDARIVAIDCRGVGEAAVKDLAGWTRPRLGWRAYDAKKLAYVDGRDGEELKVGQDECDERRVVVKSFYSWQTVDAVRVAREKRHKSTSRRAASGTGSASESEENLLTAGRARWWSPSGRSGSASPSNAMDHQNREGCRIM